MDDIARWPANDRADLFVVTGTGRGLTSVMIEKDFWVCWTLKRLFTLPRLPAGLIFKGGTSLSKVFNAIERFSEDVDLSFDRNALGFGGTNDPQNATGKERERRLDALSIVGKDVVHEQLLPQLINAFCEALGSDHLTTWALESVPDDPAGPTILFRYPAGIEPMSAQQPAYVQPIVRLEFGARSDHWPALTASVSPYAAADYPHLFKEPSCTVRALDAQRTFWEKATALHAWYHAPEMKRLGDRQSRHYYDVVKLYKHDIGKAAVKNLDLLARVVQHKSTFFPVAWARYRDAKPGTLRLVPPAERRTELERDYRQMREMIFGEPLDFEDLLEVLSQIERDVNAQ